MEAKERAIRTYVTPQRTLPFEEWILRIKDKRSRARILQRIDRLMLGNFGDCHSVGGGVNELRIHYGPGFRVYFGLESPNIVILLYGGDKNSQTKDIPIAQAYWKEYKSEKK